MASVYLNMLKKHYKLFIIIPVITLAVAVIYTVLQTPMYESQTDLLVLQKQNADMDAYTAAKASEKLGSNLAKVIYTTSFLQKVENQDVDLSYLSSDDQERRKQWKNSVSASMTPESSMLSVKAYAPTPETSASLASAISYVLAYESAEYTGAGNTITIQMVNAPTTSRYPVKPNVILNIGAALVGGLLLALILTVLLSEFKGLGKKEQPTKHAHQSAQPIFPMHTTNQHGRIKHEDTISYRVLDHNTFPETQNISSESEDTITMPEKK